MTAFATAADIVVGAEPSSRQFGPLTTQTFVRYAGASGDLNPIHYDQDFARRAGYPTVFGQGMQTAALVATFATDWLGPANLRRFQVRFSEQVWPGDVLTCTGRVSGIDDRADGRLVSVELACERADGAVALNGTADFLLALEGLA